MNPFSPKLPSHERCRVTLNRDPCISLFLHGYLLLICAHMLCHVQSSCLARASFHSEWWRVVLMVAPRIFVLTPAPCYMGTIRLFSLLPSPQESKLPSPFMDFTTTQRCGQTQRYNGHGRRGWDALSTPTPPPDPALRFLSPGGLGQEVWPHLSWSRCSLCRCLTHLGLHWVLINTAMLSCPSQEDPGEASVLGTAGVIGCHSMCVTVYICMWCM